jgi:hypothetical protein
MTEFKFKAIITIKSTRGITEEGAIKTIYLMELMANQKGDPRCHIQIEEEYYAESKKM